MSLDTVELLLTILQMVWALAAEQPVIAVAVTLPVLLLLWVLYISVMTIRDRIAFEQRIVEGLGGRWSLAWWRCLGKLALLWLVGIILLIPGYLVDVLFQVVFARFLFPGDKLRWGEWTLTARLKRLCAGPAGPNRDRAIWICKNMVEPWDRNHCGLVKLGLAK